MHSVLISLPRLLSPLRVLRGEAAHQELPSCLALEVSYTFQFPFWFLLWSSAHWRRVCLRNIKRVLRQIHISLWETDRALNTWRIEPLGGVLSVKHWKMEENIYCTECAFVGTLKCDVHEKSFVTLFFFFNLRHRVKNTQVEAEAYNQLTNPFQVWPINKVSLWRIDCKQNAAGGCPVDVLFLMACEKLLFVLYARRYCDMLRGSPLQSCSHLHWEGKHIPLQSHTHKSAHLTLELAPFLQSRQQKPHSGTLMGKISVPHVPCMRSVHLCSSSFSSSFIFLVLFSVICSQISTCNVRSRSPHSSESFKNRPTRTRGATQRVLVDAKLPGCPYNN